MTQSPHYLFSPIQSFKINMFSSFLRKYSLWKSQWVIIWDRSWPQQERGHWSVTEGGPGPLPQLKLEGWNPSCGRERRGHQPAWDGGKAPCLGHAELQGGTWLGPFCTWTRRGHSSWLLASTGGRQYRCIPSAFPQSHSRKAQCRLCQARWCRAESQGLREQQRAPWVPEDCREKDTHCTTSWALVRNSRKSDQRQGNYAQWGETSDFMTLYQCHLLIQS